VSRRWLRAGVLAAGVLVVACFELSGPPSGLSAISPIEVAWPSVVLNDQLRDSLGVVAPLTVEAFDSEGELIEDPEVQFIVLDRGLHVEPGAVVIGDSIRTSPVRVLAQVRVGNDVLQTPVANVDVVPRPDSIAPAQDTVFAVKNFPVTDLDPVTSETLTVRVLSRNPTGGAPTPVRSWIVRYEIIEEPQRPDDQHTALFSGSVSGRVVRDTTDENGLANGRTIALQRRLLPTGVGRHEVRVGVTVWRIGADAARSFVITVPFVGQ
jgi:hypothetical protein